MKTRLSLILLMLMVIMLIVSGYVSTPGNDEPVPAGDDRTIELISIQDLLENREKYDGVEVAISGTIITQCRRGCKFHINDGTGIMFVQMIGEAAENPLSPSIGKVVQARGIFYQTPRPHIIVTKDGDAVVR